MSNIREFTNEKGKEHLNAGPLTKEHLEYVKIKNSVVGDVKLYDLVEAKGDKLTSDDLKGYGLYGFQIRNLVNAAKGIIDALWWE